MGSLSRLTDVPFALACLLLICISAACRAGGAATIQTAKAHVSDSVLKQLEQGHPQVLFISFEHSAVDEEAKAMRESKKLIKDDDSIIRMEQQRFASIKEEVLARYPKGDVEVVKNYPEIPQVMARIRNMQVLKRLLNDPHVRGIYSDTVYRPASLTSP